MEPCPRAQHSARAGLPIILLLILLTPAAVACSSPTTCAAEAAANVLDKPKQSIQQWWDGLSQPTRDFLSDPLGFLYSLLAGILSIPFVLLANGISTVYGWVAGAVLSVWNFIGTWLLVKPFGFVLGLLVGLFEAAARGHTQLIDALEPYGVLGDVGLVVIDFGIVIAVAWAGVKLALAGKAAAVAYFSGGLVKQR